MEKETKVCPYCGEEILAKAIKCKHCGEFLDNNSYKQVNNEMKKCPFCAEMIPKDAIFCNICESSLNKNTTNEKPQIEYTNTDTLKTASNSAETPNNLNQWNWGAFLTTWIWGLANNSYLTLLALIPGFGFIWAFVCGLKGNEWAWQNKKWSNIEEFNNIQRKWATFSSIIISTILIFSILVPVLVITVKMAETTNPSDRVQIVKTEDEAIIVKKAVEIYHKEKNKEMAKDMGISPECYKKYSEVFKQVDDWKDALVCSDKENQAIKDYIKRDEVEGYNNEYALDDIPEPLWTNNTMPKSLVLKGVPIMCFEKANLGDNSKCTEKQLNIIKEFYKNKQELDFGKEYFEY